MPCRGEKDVATADQRGKATEPLAPGSADRTTESREDVQKSDGTEPSSGGKTTKKNNKKGQDKKQQNVDDENKENNGDSLAKKDPANQRSGLCRSGKSVEVDESATAGSRPTTQAPVTGSADSPGKPDSKNGKGGNGSKTDINKDAKPRSGLCKSNKDVQVSENAPQGQSKPASGSDPSKSATKTNETNEGTAPPSEGKPQAAKSGGGCRSKADVDVKDSLTPQTKQTKTPEAESPKQDKPVPKATNSKTPTGRSGTCCGGRSVEVEGSLRPLDKPEKGAETVKEKPEDDSFGDSVYQGLEDMDTDEIEEKEVVYTTIGQQKSAGKNGDASDDDDEKEETEEEDVIEETHEEEELKLEPEPPPPKIKKKKKGKKKKGSSGYVEDPPTRAGALTLNPRKGKYSVTTEQQEEEPLYAQVERSPTKKKSSQLTQQEMTMGTQSKATPSKKKKKRLETETNEDIRSAYENQIASLAATSGSEGGFTLNDHPTVEEESELLENAEAERKKNKQRLREKKLREVERESPVKKGDATTLAYENAQKELDKVLAPKIIADDQDDSTDSEKKRKKKSRDKGKRKKKGKDKEGEDNEAYSSDQEKVEESLEDAKAKMHQLLDDAFSLFSQSRSSMGNKVAPSKQNSQEKSPPKSDQEESPRSKQGSAKSSPREEEKKHTPIHVIRSHEPYDRSGLITWDPYKASDETAVISLPSTQTNLNAQPPRQEKLTTSTFTESLPGSLRPNYFATQPAEPIVIKSSNLGLESNPHHHQQQPDDNTGRSGYYASPGNTNSPSPPGPISNGAPGTYPHHPHHHQKQHYAHGTFQNPVYDSSDIPPPPPPGTTSNNTGSRHAPPYHQQPAPAPAHRRQDRGFEPYYGMSSYQEIPQSSSLPGQVTSAQDSPALQHRTGSISTTAASALHGVETLSYTNPTYTHDAGSSGYRGTFNDSPYVHPNDRHPGAGVGEAGAATQRHTAPQRGEDPNLDVVDAITASLQPGATPQPLIRSLREEVQVLAARRAATGGNSTAPAAGAAISGPGGEKRVGPHSLR